MKNKYVIEITDDFGSTQQKFYICSEKEIKRTLFKKYIELKQKAFKEDDVMFSDKKQYPRKLHNKTIYRDKNNNLFNFFNKQKKMNTLHLNDTYQVKLDVGFKLMHNLTYKKLDNNAEYIVTEHNVHDISCLGYFSRTKAIKLASEVIYSHPLKNDMDDEESVFKSISKDKITYIFTYWYRCSYEYDEYDESALTVIAQRINFLKI